MNEKRQSGIELLRIIAMFFILVQHANGVAIGLPSAVDCVASPLSSFCRFLIQSFSIVGVNVFVLISGWFGINFKLKRVGEYLFQCLFFSVLITILLWLINGRPDMGIKQLAGIAFMGKSYWFVKSYLLLYVLSPVLNKFIDTATKKETGFVVSLFLAIMLIFGWTDSMPEFNFGCSCISFVGLYLLARYVNKYCQVICEKPMWQYASSYLLSMSILAVICFSLYRLGAPSEITRCIFSFDNPLIIVGALSLVLFFLRLSFTSVFVNKTAKSAFSVYLFHCGPIAWALYLTECGAIYRSFSGIKMIFFMTAFLLIVFALACLLDQIRILLSSLIFQNKKNE